HFKKDILGDMGLKRPHRRLFVFQVGKAIAACVIFKVILRLFKSPGRVLGIVQRNTMIKFTSDTADGSLVAYVSGTERAGSHASKMITKLEQDRALSHACGLHSRSDPGGGAAVDAHIGLRSGRFRNRRETDHRRQEPWKVCFWPSRVWVHCLRV